MVHPTPDIPDQLTSLEPLKLLVTGGTGFIGQPLVTMLRQAGCEVTVVTRNRGRAAAGQPDPQVNWVESLEDIPHSAVVDVIINLAGESLAQGRWSAAKKQRLWDSRIQTTAALHQLVGRLQVTPGYLISGSAVGFYGPQQDQKLDEQAASVDSFSHRLCAAWEAEANRFADYGTAVCTLRLGVVLSAGGGAFTQLKQPFQFKLAAQMGAGKHYFSWIHRQDLLRIFMFLLEQKPEQRIAGAVNATAPGALTYGELCSLLAQHYRTVVKVPLPRLLMRPLLGQMADELLLSGQRVEPAKLQQHGFQFHFPALASALPNLT